MDGVTKEVPDPIRFPFVEASYHSMVEHPAAERVTVPVPQRLPFVEVGVEGLDRMVK
jgi:hypothetical protein